MIVPVMFRNTARFLNLAVLGLMLFQASPSFASSAWKYQIMPGKQIRSAIWAGDRFLAVGGNGLIMSSKDGSAWDVQYPLTQYADGPTFPYSSIAWSGERFMVSSNGRYLTSPDGESWTIHGLSGDAFFGPRVISSGNGFVGVQSNVWAWTSSDGLVWNRHDLAIEAGDVMKSVVWTGSQYVAVGGRSVHHSQDGITWTGTTLATDGLTGVAWTGTQLVAVGTQGQIWTSSDGQAWTSRSSGSSRLLESVTWTGKRLIAVGDSGAILTSPDGITWSDQSLQVPARFNYVTSGGGRVIAVGDSVVAISADTSLIPAPQLPELISPVAGAQDVSVIPSVLWAESMGAVGYHLQAATDPGFSSLVVNDSLIHSPRFHLGPLEHGTDYFWRVASRSLHGMSGFSQGKKFSTESLPVAPPDSAPALTVPGHNAAAVSIKATLGWSEIKRVTSYQVQIACDTAFSAALRDTVLAKSAVTFALGGDSLYYWRVRGRNSLGHGPWSAIRSFRTTVTRPHAPSLISPPPDSTGLNAPIVLKWEDASLGTGYAYKLQVAQDSLFSQIIYEYFAFSPHTLGTLPNISVYYWRVYAYSFGIGRSDWSQAFRFTTGSNSPIRGEARFQYITLDRGGALRFWLPENERVVMEAYDLAGRRLAFSVNKEFPRGNHTVSLPENKQTTYILKFRTKSVSRTFKIHP